MDQTPVVDLPFVIARAHVGEHRGAFVQVALGEPALDTLLAHEQPVHRLAEGVLVGVAQVEFSGQRGGVPSPGGGELRCGVEEPLHDHGSTRSRSDERLGAMSRSRPRASRASTWPWGRERSMVKASSGLTRRWPLRTRRRESTFSAGQSVRLASVRLRTRSPSRQPSRRRTAGRELRLGTVSTYMGTRIMHDFGTVSWDPAIAAYRRLR